MYGTPWACLRKTTVFWFKEGVEEDVSKELVNEHVKVFNKWAKSLIGVRTSLPTHRFAFTTRGGRICFSSLFRIFAPIFSDTFENVLSRVVRQFSHTYGFRRCVYREGKGRARPLRWIKWWLIVYLLHSSNFNYFMCHLLDLSNINNIKKCHLFHLIL